MNEITTGWDIYQIAYYEQYEGHEKVVNSVDWGYEAHYSGSEDAVYDVANVGVSKFDLGTGEFIPYSNLSKDDVLNWVWDSIGTGAKAEIEEEVYNRILLKIESTETGSFPWS